MNPKIKAALRDPYYACNLLLNRIGRFVSDEQFVKWSFYLTFHRKLDLKNPQTYNEKLQWLKLYDRREEYTQMVDKCEAKKYVASIIGEEYIIPTLGVYNSFDEINFDELPNQFVLKCTHNSGGLIICRDKQKLNITESRILMNKWLKKNPFWANREWPYKNVKPRLITEQFMSDGRTVESGLTDFKFFCFNGEVKFLYVSQGLEDHSTASISFFDLNGDRLPFKRTDYKGVDKFTPPSCFEKMKDVANLLAKKIDNPFIRIDLYEVSGSIYFSELTFFPCSGLLPFDPPEWDKIIGDYLKLPNNKV